MPYLRYISCVALLALTAWTPSSTSSLTQSPAATVGPSSPVVSGMFEVRLRKLHLVRPDLIPYPIAYEVCC